MKKPQVSIIMPLYNCEKYLAQAIESVMKQTHKDWELIIVDDGSTDNGVKIINEYIKKCLKEESKQQPEKNIENEGIWQKIKLIKLEKNCGVAKARNVALKETLGRYIAYLDSDDIWEKQKLKKQIKFMQENDCCFTHTRFQYLKGNKIKPVKKIPQKQSYKDALKDTMILTSTVIVDTNQIDKKLLEMPNIEREDAATWWKLLKNGYTAYGLDEVLTTYRRRRDSLSNNKFIAARGTWRLYRKIEKMPFAKALSYFICYGFNAVKRRIL